MIWKIILSHKIRYLFSLSHSSLNVKLSFLRTGFETQNKYKIFNSQGQHIYNAQEETGTMLRKYPKIAQRIFITGCFYSSSLRSDRIILDPIYTFYSCRKVYSTFYISIHFRENRDEILQKYHLIWHNGHFIWHFFSHFFGYF